MNEYKISQALSSQELFLMSQCPDKNNDEQSIVFFKIDSSMIIIQACIHHIYKTYIKSIGITIIHYKNHQNQDDKSHN